MVALACSYALASCGSATPPESSQTESSPTEQSATTATGRQRAILTFGDSLLAGHGLRGGESYPARLEASLRARGVNAKITNSGIPGDTTQQALARLAGVLAAQPAKPDLVIVSLGANDMLQGIPPAQTRANLDRILQVLKARAVRVVLIGMMAAPDLSAKYARGFNPIYPALAHEHGAVLVPVFLQPWQGEPGWVQPDQVHPTALGVDEIVSATVDDVVAALPPDAART